MLQERDRNQPAVSHKVKPHQLLVSQRQASKFSNNRLHSLVHHQVRNHKQDDDFLGTPDVSPEREQSNHDDETHVGPNDLVSVFGFEDDGGGLEI